VIFNSFLRKKGAIRIRSNRTAKRLTPFPTNPIKGIYPQKAKKQGADILFNNVV